MPRWMKRAFIASLFGVAACSSGSGGCSSCSGVTPLPQGFPIDKRIENAASVRLTDSGLQFINDNLTALVNQFGSGLLVDGKFEQGIPSTSTALGPITANVCPQGPDLTSNPKKCVIEADIGKAKLSLAAAAPHTLALSGPMPVRAQLINIEAPLGPIKLPIQVSIGKNADNACASQNFADVPIAVDISIVADTNPAHGTRTGLSRVKIEKFDLNIDKGDIHICGKCDVPIVCNVWDAVIGGIGGLVKGLLIDQLKKPIQDQVDNALCIKGNPMSSLPCPLGSHPDDPNDAASKCVFDDGSGDCASFALGTEGTLDLSGALASFSPTTTGGIDFLFSLGGLSANPNAGGAPYGDLNPINSGATLSMTGGGEPNPVASCVKQVALQRPEGIPTPDELMANTVDGWPAGTAGPHFGLAISERFANYAFGGIYNSGLLCVQITTEQVAQLNSKAVGLLVNSFGTLPLQKQNAPVGLVLKPTVPPSVVFGNGTSLETDPTMLVHLPALGIDFYVWSSDRYIRAFTITMDLDIPVNLSVTKEGLLPQLNTIKTSNSKVTNSFLLKEDPATIAKGIEAIIGGAVGQALGGGALKPIDLSSALASLGFTLNIPESTDMKGSPGLRKLTKGTDNFLGIFAGLGIAPSMPTMLKSKTQGLIADRDIKPEGLRLATMTKENDPVIYVRASSSVDDGTHQLEYSYQVDHGFWHPWTRETPFAVRDDILRLQGKHAIHVKSRIVGDIWSEEDESLELPVTMDVDAPAVELKKLDTSGKKLVLRAADNVAEDHELQVRYAFDDKGFGSWVPYVAGMEIANEGVKQVRVEVKDGEGNIGSISQELRGKVDTTGQASSGGCGCTVPGQSQPTLPLSGLAIAGVLAFLRLARRRRAKELAAGAAVMAVAGSWTGCSCSSSDDTTADSPPPAEQKGGAGGESGAGGSGPAGMGGAGNPCVGNPECTALEPGLVGSYTSAATTSDGTVWVAGYNEADYGGEVPTYGDLVVGKYDPAGGKVAWETADGIDLKEEVDPTLYDAEGWRKGYANAGDDVGLWTSVQIGDGDKPVVAYYDVTHGALKFASYDGTKWTAHTVQTKKKAQIGRYAKMVMIDKKPVIAFNFVEPGMGGAVSSGVRVARGKSATPGGDADWSFEDVYVNPATPCRASNCDTGTKCSSVSGKCEAGVTGCTPPCSSTQECLPAAGGPACTAILTNAQVDAYPTASGLYVAAAFDPAKKDLGLVFYDRLRGNLWAAAKAGGAWAPKLVDGQNGDNPGTDTGDVGIGASLAIDKAGDYHVAYVDGLKEGVKYLKLAGGTTPDAASSGIVDDGRPPGSPEPSPDGHIIGDDSSIVVSDKGISVAYQDATTGKLRVATRPLSGGAWAVKEVKSDDKAFAGFFSLQVTTGGKALVGNFSRTGGAKPAGDVSFVPAP
jgi:hypothetical protein